MHNHIGVSPNGRREVRIDRNVQGIVLILGNVKHARADILGLKHRFGSQDFENELRILLGQLRQGCHECARGGHVHLVSEPCCALAEALEPSDNGSFMAAKEGLFRKTGRNLLSDCLIGQQHELFNERMRVVPIVNVAVFQSTLCVENKRELDLVDAESSIFEAAITHLFSHSLPELFRFQQAIVIIAVLPDSAHVKLLDIASNAFGIMIVMDRNMLRQLATINDGLRMSVCKLSSRSDRTPSRSLISLLHM